MMKVKILQQSKEAIEAEGLTVIIDVFRAFTTACKLVDRGAASIIPVSDSNTAIQIHNDNTDYLLIGERKGIKLDAADYGNSPKEILNNNFANKTVVFTTSAGTKGFSAARHADQLITGSFVNADAVVTYIKLIQPETVSLVCMGFRDERPSDEDTLCANYIKQSLMGIKVTQEEIINALKKSPDSEKFFNPATPWATEEDFYLCTELDKHNFILKLDYSSKYQQLKVIYLDELEITGT